MIKRVKHLGNPKAGKRLITTTVQLPDRVIKVLDEETKKIEISRQRLIAAILATALKDPKFIINWDALD